MRRVLPLIALCWASLSAPALAETIPAKLTAVQRACPIKAIPADQAREFARTMTVEPTPEVEAKQGVIGEAVGKAILGCIGDKLLSDDEMKVFIGFISVKLGQDGAAAELSAIGIDPALVRQGLDVGPGRGNKDIDDPSVERLVASLKAEGIAITEETVSLIVVYAELTRQVAGYSS